VTAPNTVIEGVDLYGTLKLGPTATKVVVRRSILRGPAPNPNGGLAVSGGGPHWDRLGLRIEDSRLDLTGRGGEGMVVRRSGFAGARDSLPDHKELYRRMLALTARGAPLTQARVRNLVAGPGAILLCGRFEGFDERIFEARDLEPVSIGDYVLSGGELGAMVLLDACVRLLPGVMGAASSGEEESFETGLLEYPHYTRPVEWEGRTIPEVLRSGDHARIAAWRHERASEDTRLRRPDLIERHGGASQAPPSGARHEDEGQDQ
jgi:tRNA (guanine37-N1)-methyltransferase